MQLLLLLLPTLIVGKIKIDVTCNDTQHKIEYEGRNLYIISDSDIPAFNLTSDNLKKCVGIYYGAEPDNVNLKDPTRWGDLYAKYRWKQVTKTLYPYETKILSHTSTPLLVLTQVFNNTSTSVANFKAPIRQYVNNTVSTSWKKSGELSMSGDISYRFKLTSRGVRNSAVKLLATYTSKWGKNVLITETVNAGHGADLQMTLEPKQSIVADLIAVKYVLTVKISYLASLYGATVVNYAKLYKGHHFWSLDSNSVMDACGLPMSIPSTETVVLNYFTESKVVIRDYQTRKMLDVVRFKIRKGKDESKRSFKHL